MECLIAVVVLITGLCPMAEVCVGLSALPVSSAATAFIHALLPTRRSA